MVPSIPHCLSRDFLPGFCESTSLHIGSNDYEAWIPHVDQGYSFVLCLNFNAIHQATHCHLTLLTQHFRTQSASTGIRMPWLPRNYPSRCCTSCSPIGCL